MAPVTPRHAAPFDAAGTLIEAAGLRAIGTDGLATLGELRARLDLPEADPWEPPTGTTLATEDLQR
jgi:hypothetical protein